MQNTQKTEITLKDWKKAGGEFNYNFSIYKVCKNCEERQNYSNVKLFFYTRKNPDSLKEKELDNFCYSCYLRKDKNGNMLPKEVCKILKKQNFVNFETFLTFKDNYNSKAKV